jgi:phospholipase A2
VDSTPSQLTPRDSQLCLVDAGYFINNSCPSMLRRGRQLDLILSFNYSLSSPFEVPLVAPREPQTLCPARPSSRGKHQGH